MDLSTALPLLPSFLTVADGAGCCARCLEAPVEFFSGRLPLGILQIFSFDYSSVGGAELLSLRGAPLRSKGFTEWAASSTVF